MSDALWVLRVSGDVFGLCNALVLRPSLNLSGNGRAAMSRDTGVTNRDLDASHGVTKG